MRNHEHVDCVQYMYGLFSFAATYGRHGLRCFSNHEDSVTAAQPEKRIFDDSLSNWEFVQWLELLAVARLAENEEHNETKICRCAAGLLSTMAECNDHQLAVER